MGQISRNLYDFLLQHKCNMTNEWFQTRDKSDGSTYSANAPEKIAEQLRQQNTEFIEAVSSVFIQEREDYLNSIERWVEKVAEERAQQNVALHEVIAQLRIFRTIYWNYVRKFFGQAEQATSEDALRWSEAMNQAFDYIIENFAIQHYEANKKILASQQEMIDELSSTVIPIKAGIGILPLVGDIDPSRAKTILESTLEQSVSKNLHTLFIDLSAVAVIDTMVAQQLFQLMASLRIIGVQSVLSGIRPEIAQTAVTLGISFKDIEIYANLMRALETHKE
ncbi:STAS domain-containing protein [Planococcus salinus]|uniref:STAS domain-containing protein n=1 Tax=Planococcus salinus TaxID=1848460 RepID=A0A3M8P651_9BACL|nr:STAS domain-containing protein [Planococcus salinus]RNF39147.1 STAS domain-containing protein [Planococcus salinus]